MTTYLVFVYGSLKRGFHNHRLLENSKFLGPAKTTAEYEMFPLAGGAFPVIVPGNYAINGELYEVDETTLKLLDRLESNGSMYQREVTDIPSHDQLAWVYVFMHPTRGSPSDSQYVKTEDGEQTWRDDLPIWARASEDDEDYDWEDLED